MVDTDVDAKQIEHRQGSHGKAVTSAKRAFWPGCTSASTRRSLGFTVAKREHKAVPGFAVARPEPQLDSSGSPAHSPISTAVAIAGTAKPATWLLRFRFGEPAWPTASHRIRTVKNRSRQVLVDKRSNLSGTIST